MLVKNVGQKPRRTKVPEDKSPGFLSARTKAPAFKMHGKTKAPVLNFEYNFVCMMCVFFVNFL